MKKTYNSPELRIVNIAATRILAGSLTQSVKGNEHSSGGTLSGSRRRNSVWDDEEEDF